MKFKKLLLPLSLITIILILAGSLFFNKKQFTNYKDLRKKFEDSLVMNQMLLDINQSIFQNDSVKTVKLMNQFKGKFGENQYLISAKENFYFLNKINTELDSVCHDVYIQNEKYFSLQKKYAQLENNIDNKNIVIDSLVKAIKKEKNKNKNNKQKITDLENELVKSNESTGRLNFKNELGYEVSYYGQIKNNQSYGYGIGIYAGKGVYEGEWKNNVRHGNGLYIWSNGDKYEGNFVEGKREGKGTYYFSTGEKYIGEWKKDLREGKGQFFDENGKLILEGVWKEDKYQKVNGNNEKENEKVEDEEW